MANHLSALSLPFWMCSMFRYLVGVSGAVVAHSLLQLLISVSRLRRKAAIIPSQNYAWVVYVGDQVKCLILVM